MGKFKHGLGNKHPLFKVWCEMRYRCNNPKKENYKYYGGRGIRVCQRWMQFENFVQDMGARPPGTTLDRINVNGDYEPSNCRWADIATQRNNTSANKYIFIDGEEISVADACRKYLINDKAAYYRLSKGWSAEKTFKTPVRQHREYRWKSLATQSANNRRGVV